MTTKDQYITQAKADNPKPMFATINGEQVELSDAEYDATIEAWADMRVSQDVALAEAEALLAVKRSGYTKLGLTEQEIDALLGVVNS